jgi:hypothetical protein
MRRIRFAVLMLSFLAPTLAPVAHAEDKPTSEEASDAKKVKKSKKAKAKKADKEDKKENEKAAK